MLEFDTAKRATAAHMLTHPWLEVPTLVCVCIHVLMYMRVCVRVCV